MLFDLQGRGRKNVVKVIYLSLAILMGGGLVLFGIGTGTSGGGLFDIFSNQGEDTQVLVRDSEKRADRAVKRNPKDPEAWADLARARFQGAEYDDAQAAYTEDGREKLRTAAAAWQRYLELDPKRPDATLARLMANAYAENALDQPDDAAAALEIVTEQDPSASSFGLLAQYAYLAGQYRKGDLAAAEAVERSPKSQRKLVERQLATIKRRITEQAVQEAAQQGAATAPSG